MQGRVCAMLEDGWVDSLGLQLPFGPFPQDVAWSARVSNFQSSIITNNIPGIPTRPPGGSPVEFLPCCTTRLALDISLKKPDKDKEAQY